jgi:hypothetical protein
MRVQLLAIFASTLCDCYPHPCGYYPLSAYKVIDILDYYINLYAILNNAVITICKFK